MERWEEEEESVKVDELLDDRLASVDVSDDVSALTQDEELSEEFMNGSTILVVVKSKLRSEVERIEMETVEEINRVQDELTKRLTTT